MKNFRFTFFLFIVLSAVNTFAQYTKLLDFGKPTDGKFPHSSLISDGTFLYGMTKNGGVNDMGAIFKIKPDGTEYAKLFDFDSINGKNPYGDLFSDGVFLYGMTYYGGTHNKGVIFKIMPSGIGYSKLLDFNGTNGCFPLGSFISDGTFLYGMTHNGGPSSSSCGSSGCGVIFKIMPDGTGYTNLLDFTDTIGSGPEGSLISDGTFLYGMASNGGINSKGVLFKIKPDGTGYSDLLDFAGTSNGKFPFGSLISDGIFLYGMTYQGGINNLGVIFKIKPDGTSYSKMLDFVGTSNGSHPYGSLIFDSTFLYGMTSDGGINNSYGTLFKIKSDGTGYSKLLDFSGYPANGKLPYGSLISTGNFFYGMTCDGGKNDIGAIFKIKSDGIGYTNLPSFGSSANGADPSGSLISDGTFLYGMTSKGGLKDTGVVFKIKPEGTGYSKLLDFKNFTNGSFPYFGSLVSDGIFLYGMTYQGGTNNLGVIFKIKPDGTSFSKLLDFAGSSNGSHPHGSLIFNGLFLYGMTSQGGTYNAGIVFKIMPDGSGFVDLYNFTWSSADGGYPEGALISDGTFLYGMTQNGGSSSHGTLFKIMPDGSGYVDLYNFTDGEFPTGSLIFDGAFLYGMTSQGGTGTSSGTSGCGIIFKIKPDGTGYLKLHDLAGSPDGCEPLGSLISDGTFLFGMTKHGGTNDGDYGMGVFFKIKSDGTDYTILHNFGGAPIDGSYPDGSLISDGTFLYGMTHEGGANTVGIIFKYQYCSPITFTQSPILCGAHSLTIGSNTYSTSGTYTDIINSLVNGCDSTVTTHLTIIPVNTTVTISNATLTANATGANYQWINCNGNMPIAGQTNQSFTATTSGSYAVIVSQNSCTDTSTCHSITIAGIDENSFASLITVYPNPFSSQTTITFNKEQKNTLIKITDELGQRVKTFNVIGKQLIIEKGEMKAGAYFLQMQTEQGTISKKLIITK